MSYAGPELSIGIATRNRRPLLRGCLESLYGHPPRAAFEALVIDNGSEDGTPEMVRAEFPAVRLTANARNQGIAGGYNQFVRASRGNFLVRLDDDTVVPAGALDTLTDILRREPEVGIIGPRLVSPEGERQHSCRAFPDPLSIFLRGLRLTSRFPGAGRLGRYLMEDVDLARPSRVDWVLGACLMAKREVFERAGLFDPRLGHHDDTDFCYRARLAGFATVFCPAVRVVHHYQRVSARSWFSRSRWRHIENMVYLFRKHRFFRAARRTTPARAPQTAEER